MVQWFLSTGKCFSSPHKLNSLIFSHSGSNEKSFRVWIFYFFIFLWQKPYYSLLSFNSTKKMYENVKILSVLEFSLNNTEGNQTAVTDGSHSYRSDYRLVCSRVYSCVCIDSLFSCILNKCSERAPVIPFMWEHNLKITLLTSSLRKMWRLHKASIENDQTKPKKDLNLLPTKWCWIDVFNT